MSIVLITTLQGRADASRDAEVDLQKIGQQFEALQTYPYDVIGASAAFRAQVARRMQERDREITRDMARLQRDAPSSHLADAKGPYRSNVRVLGEIRRLLELGQDGRADSLGAVAGNLQAAVDRQLALAGRHYQRRASISLRLATLGSAGAILTLLSLFAFFYLRSRRALHMAQALTDENARLQVHDAQVQVLQRLALAAEYRDDDTGQHTRRVGKLAAAIGADLGMPADQVDLLRQAAPLHDVGKIGIADSILLKLGPLTLDEYDRMRAHTMLGANMLAGGRGLPLLAMAEQIALTHHERWDGTGYPAGLIGSAIPLVGRIVAVADVYDALTHARPYKEAWTVAAARAEITAQAGRQFDPAVVEAFLRVLPDAACSPPPPGTRRDADERTSEVTTAPAPVMSGRRS